MTRARWNGRAAKLAERWRASGRKPVRGGNRTHLANLLAELWIRHRDGKEAAVPVPLLYMTVQIVGGKRPEQLAARKKRTEAATSRAEQRELARKIWTKDPAAYVTDVARSIQPDNGARGWSLRTIRRNIADLKPS